MDIEILKPHGVLDYMALAIILCMAPKLAVVLVSVIVWAPDFTADILAGTTGQFDAKLAKNVALYGCLAVVGKQFKIVMELAVRTSLFLISSKVVGINSHCLLISFGAALIIGCLCKGELLILRMLNLDEVNGWVENMKLQGQYRPQIFHLHSWWGAGFSAVVDVCYGSILLYGLLKEIMGETVTKEETVVEETKMQNGAHGTCRVVVDDDVADSRLNHVIVAALAASSSEKNTAARAASPASYPQNNSTGINTQLSSSVSAAIANFDVFFRRKALKTNQPLWSIVAALHSMRSRSDIFSGQVGPELESDSRSLVRLRDSRILSFADINFPLKGFITYIGQTIMAFQIVSPEPETVSMLQKIDVLVLVNGIEWNTHTYNDEYVIIIGLSPGFMYDVELFVVSKNHEVHSEALIAKYIICTKNEQNQAGHMSTFIETPLETLKKSVTTTNNLVLRERLKLRKMKKENSKTLADLSKEIEILNKKVRESDKFDEKLWKRVGALKAETKQIEEEIQVMKRNYETEQHAKKKFEAEYESSKHRYDMTSTQFSKEETEHGEDISALQDTLNQLKQEVHNLDLKNEKMRAKINKNEAEFASYNSQIDEREKRFLTRLRFARSNRAQKRDSLLKEFQMEIGKVEEMSGRFKKQIAKLKEEM